MSDGRPKSKNEASVDQMAERIFAAVMEHRLPPGTKLVEERLAEVFGVSRTKVRLALARLAHDNILTVYPNRGTFVASPTIEEARHVFGARRILEPLLVRQLADTATKDQITTLRRSVASETQARNCDDRHAIIRLSGDFHIGLAEMTGNPYLLKSVRELASLTCLIIALYDSPRTPACPHHEHHDIVDAIQRRDSSRAAALMIGHLEHVEQMLDLRPSSREEVDLEQVFGYA